MKGIHVKIKQTEVTKVTTNDTRGYLSTALKEKVQRDLYVEDFDDTYVYYETYDYSEGYSEYKMYKMAFSLDGVNITLTGDPIKVVRESTYTEIVESESTDKLLTDKLLTEKGLTRSIVGAIKQLFTIEKGEKERIVLKAFDDEKKIAIMPLYCPPLVADSDDEGMDATTIKGMVDSLNKAIDEDRLKASLDHKEFVDWFYIRKAWVNPCPCTINNHDVEEGQPIAEVQFNDDDKWDELKKGNLLGLSIGAGCDSERVDYVEGES